MGQSYILLHIHCLLDPHGAASTWLGALGQSTPSKQLLVVHLPDCMIVACP